MSLLTASMSISCFAPSGVESLLSMCDNSSAATVSFKSTVCCTYLAQRDFKPGDISMAFAFSGSSTTEAMRELGMQRFSFVASFEFYSCSLRGLHCVPAFRYFLSHYL